MPRVVIDLTLSEDEEEELPEPPCVSEEDNPVPPEADDQRMMSMAETESKFEELANLHGLRGWRLVWSESTRRAGQTWYKRNTIDVSRKFVVARPRTEV